MTRVTAALAFLVAAAGTVSWANARYTARAEVLLGDAASSPLTERPVQLTFGGFIAYRL